MICFHVTGKRQSNKTACSLLKALSICFAFVSAIGLARADGQFQNLLQVNEWQINALLDVILPEQNWDLEQGGRKEVHRFEGPITVRVYGENTETLEEVTHSLLSVSQDSLNASQSKEALDTNFPFGGTEEAVQELKRAVFPDRDVNVIGLSDASD